MSANKSNAIGHPSRQYVTGAWQGKPASAIGTFHAVIGTALMQQHLRNVLAYLGMTTLNQPEAFVQFKDGLIDDEGKIDNDSTRKFLQGWMDAYAGWVEAHAQ